MHFPGKTSTDLIRLMGVEGTVRTEKKEGRGKGAYMVGKGSALRSEGNSHSRLQPHL